MRRSISLRLQPALACKAKGGGRMERRASLPRPPRVPPALQEFPAVVEPALRDIDDPPETLIEGFELVESQSPRVAVPATTEMADIFREAVFADERIQRLLVDKRHAVLGASRLLDDKEREVPASL